MMAQTKRGLVSRGAAKPRAALATLRFDEFRGGRETVTHQYRTWRKQADHSALARLIGAGDGLDRLHSGEKPGEAASEVLEVTDLEKPGGLAMVWSIWDRARERMERERADDAYGAWESANRRPGQSIEEWLTYLRAR